jgi:hypothetical protein
LRRPPGPTPTPSHVEALLFVVSPGLPTIHRALHPLRTPGVTVLPIALQGTQWGFVEER